MGFIMSAVIQYKQRDFEVQIQGDENMVLCGYVVWERAKDGRLQRIKYVPPADMKAVATCMEQATRGIQYHVDTTLLRGAPEHGDAG